jgi:hypothetical protein
VRGAEDAAALLPGDARQPEDPAVAAAHHAADDRSETEKTTPDIDRKKAIELLDRQLPDLRGAGDARVVDQDVDAAELRFDGGDACGDRLLIGDVELYAEGPAAEPASVSLGSFTIEVRERDGAARLCKRLADGVADAGRRAAAGYQRNAAVESKALLAQNETLRPTPCSSALI